MFVGCFPAGTETHFMQAFVRQLLNHGAFRAKLLHLFVDPYMVLLFNIVWDIVKSSFQFLCNAE
uniref:Uncharacterized protein n=1 Tax=Oryza brachyantha TaxID=4533 RepID=J3LFJ8_ORYBR